MPVLFPSSQGSWPCSPDTAVTLERGNRYRFVVFSSEEIEKEALRVELVTAGFFGDDLLVGECGGNRTLPEIPDPGNKLWTTLDPSVHYQSLYALPYQRNDLDSTAIENYIAYCVEGTYLATDGKQITCAHLTGGCWPGWEFDGTKCVEIDAIPGNTPPVLPSSTTKSSRALPWVLGLGLAAGAGYLAYRALR